MPPETPDIWTLGDLATPWSLHVVVTLRIAEQLEAAGGAMAVDKLAAGAKAEPDSLYRVLRHLIERGLFTENSPGIIGLNEPARRLLDPGIRLGFDLDGFGGRMAGAWSTLLDTVRQGEPGYQHAFGLPFWQDLDAHPDLAAEFDALMGPVGHGLPDPDILVTGDWDSVRTVVDVGGGTGALLGEILRAHAHLRGVLVDRPSTLMRARQALGAAGLEARVTLTPQSFFDPLPAGADLYLLKSVLSDWPDRDAQALLTRCTEAARPNGRLVVVNGVSPDAAGPPSPDLLMMVLVGGRQRSLSEFSRLASSVGLRVSGTKRQPSGRFLVECRPAGASDR
jgi:2,7-dihydroxy-5-methyl-1-naphthoate 7-O-methyltransferase